MMTKTLTLTEFLLARIAELEEVAQAVPEAEPKSGTRFFTSLHEPTGTVEFNPAHVLAECEAKRRIVNRYVDTTYIEPVPATAYDLALFDVMRDMAAVYADHPDYRDEWRP